MLRNNSVIKQQLAELSSTTKTTKATLKDAKKVCAKRGGFSVQTIVNLFARFYAWLVSKVQAAILVDVSF